MLNRCHVAAIWCDRESRRRLTHPLDDRVLNLPDLSWLQSPCCINRHVQLKRIPTRQGARKPFLNWAKKAPVTYLKLDLVRERLDPSMFEREETAVDSASKINRRGMPVAFR